MHQGPYGVHNALQVTCASAFTTEFTFRGLHHQLAVAELPCNLLRCRSLPYTGQDKEASSSTFETRKLVVYNKRMLEILLGWKSLCVHNKHMFEALSRWEGLYFSTSACLIHSQDGKVCVFTTNACLKHFRDEKLVFTTNACWKESRNGKACVFTTRASLKRPRDGKALVSPQAPVCPSQANA